MTKPRDHLNAIQGERVGGLALRWGQLLGQKAENDVILAMRNPRRVFPNRSNPHFLSR